MMRRAAVFVSVCLLAAVALGLLPWLPEHSFSHHMVSHMLIVAVVAPLFTLGLAGGPWDPVSRVPGLFSPFLASLLEFVVVWGWHVPALHNAARQSAAVSLLELASYLAVGLLLWFAAFGGGSAGRLNRSAAGIAGLLLTSMHMALLGVLLALADRPLYSHLGGAADWGLTPLQDQEIGGVIMLSFGGSIYLIGGLYLLARILRGSPEAATPVLGNRYEN